MQFLRCQTSCSMPSYGYEKNPVNRGPYENINFPHAAERLRVTKLVQKSPASYGTLRFVPSSLASVTSNYPEPGKFWSSGIHFDVIPPTQCLEFPRSRSHVHCSFQMTSQSPRYRVTRHNVVFFRDEELLAQHLILKLETTHCRLSQTVGLYSQLPSIFGGRVKIFCSI